MRIAIIGAGAMGAIHAMALHRAGAACVLVDRPGAHLDAIARDGLVVQRSGAEQHARFETASGAEGVAPCAAAIILVNTYDTAAAARTAAALLAPDGYAITLQNGVGNIEALAAELGRARVLAGLSYHSAAVLAPGRVAHTHEGPTWLGELAGPPTARVADLAALLAAGGLRPEPVSDIETFVWGKFVHNCAINALCAVGGLRVGELSWYAAADAFQSHIIAETLAVVRALGHRPAEPDPEAAIKAFCRVKFNRPSMLQHLEAGRRTEIDALNGVVVREGARLGIPTPFSAALVLMVQAIEARNAEHAARGAIDWDVVERAAKRD